MTVEKMKTLHDYLRRNNYIGLKSFVFECLCRVDEYEGLLSRCPKDCDLGKHSLRARNEECIELGAPPWCLPIRRGERHYP